MIPDFCDLIGTPFKIGGRGPDVYDCYGLIMEMNLRDGITVPDVLSISKPVDIESLMDEKKQLWKRTKIIPKSTLIFSIKGYGAHVGYVISPTRFIHTWEGTGGVTIERISLWKKRILGAYRYDV